MTLLEEISSTRRLRQCWSKILQNNKQTAGIDEQTLNDFAISANTNLKKIKKELLSGKYQFNQVLFREIQKKPNSNKKRKIGLYTIRDKVVQKSIQLSFERKRNNQLMFPKIINDISIGFIQSSKDTKRVGISTAIEGIKKLYDNGYSFMVTLDIKDFFVQIKRVDLENIIKSNLIDHSIDYLINQCLNPQVIKIDMMGREQTVQSSSGVTQGSILSPLLSNVYLMDFDEAIKQSNIPAYRFADDLVIFAKSRRKAISSRNFVMELLKKHAYGLEFYPIGDEKGPRIYCLDNRGGEYLGLFFQVNGRKEWKVVPTDKSIANQKDKITKLLSTDLNDSFVEKVKSANISSQSWYTYYAKGCGCYKRHMKVIFDEIRKYFEEKVNTFLLHHRIINSDLSSSKLKIIGILPPKRGGIRPIIR